MNQRMMIFVVCFMLGAQMSSRTVHAQSLVPGGGDSGSSEGNGELGCAEPYDCWIDNYEIIEDLGPIELSESDEYYRDLDPSDPSAIAQTGYGPSFNLELMYYFESLLSSEHTWTLDDVASLFN